jgi:hypothetical protein
LDMPLDLVKKPAQLGVHSAQCCRKIQPHRLPLISSKHFVPGTG